MQENLLSWLGNFKKFGITTRDTSYYIKHYTFYSVTSTFLSSWQHFHELFAEFQSSRTLWNAACYLAGTGGRSNGKNCVTSGDCFKFHMPVAVSAAGQSPRPSYILSQEALTILRFSSHFSEKASSYVSCVCVCVCFWVVELCSKVDE